MGVKTCLKRWDNNNQFYFVIYTMLASFFTYSCMYAFRKPFTVATYGDLHLWGVHYKIWLITSQVIGYTLSKFIGIKLVSEMTSSKRALTLLIAVGIAQTALLLFAITPAPYNIVWMFFNGLPLGIIWGLVFSYLEGRRTTELLGAGLSISFIFSSGFVKTTGKLLMQNFNITEIWMPFMTGLLFTLPLICSVWLLNQVPAPNEEDNAMRTLRKPMSKIERKDFFHRFSMIIIPLTFIYIFLTILRDIRDNFAAEIWESLGKGTNSAIFTTAEIPVGFGVLVVISLMVLIRNNLKALYFSILTVILGLILNILATLAFRGTIMGGYTWMVMVGFGLYIGYIAFHALIFERLIATFRYIGNVGFLFYFADAFGYLGSVSSFILKNFFSADISWLNFFSGMIINLSVSGIALCLFTLFIIKSQYKKKSSINFMLINKAL